MLDLIGQVFSRLTVVERVKEPGIIVKWKCVCLCGKIVIARSPDLRSGNTKSCGCYKIDGIVSRSLKHGHANKTAEYRAWCHMKTRCYTETVERYPKYGGRGIVVCDRWINSFENFFADMGYRPSPLHSLDRIEVNGNYDPLNCRWATRAEQSRNTTKNRWLEISGERKILTDWAIELKTNASILWRMIKKKGFEESYKFYKNKA